MIPMDSSIEELGQIFSLIKEVKHELAQERYNFDPDIPIGGLIEVPAVAIAADLFACRLDFLSIGANDLIQYTLAIDRVDDEVNYFYDSLHPSVLRLIRHTIKAGEDVGIPVSMCGEMAGDVNYTRPFIGMGLREFSMDPSSLLEVKRQIRLTDVTRLDRRVDAILREADPGQLRSLVSQLNT